jgi:choline kinase
MADTSVIIPAAGQGRRMKSYGPKGMIPLVKGQTVLSRQVSLIKADLPSGEILVVLGFQAERVKRSLGGVKVKTLINEDYENTNVVHSISLGLEQARHRRVIIVYGDLVFTPGMLDSIPRQGSFALIDNTTEELSLRKSEVGMNIVNGRVTHFAYGVWPKWAQVLALSGKELAMFRQYSARRDRRMYFGFEILNEIIDRGGIIEAVETDATIMEIDTSKDIGPARKLVAREMVGA